ncbi:helix-hairpin-helix domain-containing protein [Chloroflexus sp.]|uniref:helix-hairpin-helix domain-containing protein n=1 Tax=Chloroflexus sp. TaxID=1904827 RepID=UPI002ACDF36A|nr:helix-hairpin-helix domain-containing protein [Chloroflexus sp.]
MRDDRQLWYRRPQRIVAIICALVGGLLIAFGPEARAMWWSNPVVTVEDALTIEALPTATATPLVVYVSGAVTAPDVYRLTPGARVIDALQAAGGLTEQADVSGLNLAAQVRDGEHIRVPYAGEVAAQAEVSETAGLINLNRASAAELEELPGIGATLAARIIERRETQGPYRSVAELREVSGIGEKLYSQIAPLVTIDP